MGSREKILQAVRAAGLAPRDRPDLAQPWIEYADRQQQFVAALQSVGGRCEVVAQRDEIAARLAEHPAFASAKKIVSLLPALPGNVDLNSIDDPHQLEDVDFAILPGEFGVAENGAVWATDSGIKHRAIYFIVQHLVLVLPAEQLVHNMHQAYERLSLGQRSFGVFISGPSKTADIEQSLVIGAHGPRSMTVFLVSDIA